MIGEVLAGVSTLASLFGSLKSAQANQNVDAQLKNRQSDLQSWYDKEYNTNYLDTSAAKGTLQVLRNNNKETMQKVNQGNVIGGASAEQAVATADAVNKDYANNVAGIAAQGTAHNDRVRAEYDGQKANLDQLEAGNLQQKSQNWANFGNNAMNAGIGMATAGAEGAFGGTELRLKNLRKNAILKKAGGAVTPVPTTNLKAPVLHT